MSTEIRSPSRRFAALAARKINKDTFIQPWPEAGLKAMCSPADPRPSVSLDDDGVVEMDGVRRENFDFIDRFIARYALDLEVVEETMKTDSLVIARKLVDIDIPRQEIVRIMSGCTPAKLVDVMGNLNVLEMMMALAKMRVRRTPSNQAHVTNRKEHPALLAADAAEAALRGFSENESTVGVARYAPLTALAVLVGSQIGRGGVLTQCAVEEAVNLRLAIKGLTSYSETLSVYGTSQAFVDGDDTPWSKAFLASAYASRGVKIRFTSGTGSEALMGHSQGKSMLYLEARCLMVVKGAGSQGVQNGSISCIALPESLPGGVRAVLAENLLATVLGLELASGNDALASHSDIRKSAKLMLQFIPGTDFITSGYSSIPKEDNLFGGGNFDAEDLDDWCVLQRDMQVDGGISPIRETESLKIRAQAARAIQAVYAELDFPPITDAEVEAATTAHSSNDMPERDKVADLEAADVFLDGSQTALDVVCALDNKGFVDGAERLLEMLRQRVIGDYLQPAAIFDKNFRVRSGLNDANDYAGPGTGYRLDGERWRALQALPQTTDPKEIISPKVNGNELFMHEVGPAERGTSPEVVLAVGPAFGEEITETLTGTRHVDVLRAILDGILGEGLSARVMKIYHTSDCAFIGHSGAKLSGSGVAIGLQSRGTTVIHHRDLAPLNNLELFPQAPNLTLDTYRRIGRNAACYALRHPVPPIKLSVDNHARLRLIVKTTLMHWRETQQIEVGAPPIEVRIS